MRQGFDAVSTICSDYIVGGVTGHTAGDAHGKKIICFFVNLVFSEYIGCIPYHGEVSLEARVGALT